MWESAAGVGNPFSLGAMRSGDIVVDIGCGCGADVCISAILVGGKGRAIGIDITPAMITKARTASQVAGITNASFLVGSMEQLPFPDSLADVVISNGSINLSPHKPCVFKEIHRILAPGGQLLFADMVREGAADEQCGSWANCVSGTVEPNSYLKMRAAAGFEDAELVEFSGYKTALTTIGATFRARKKASDG